jgi:hypothetical protein
MTNPRSRISIASLNRQVRTESDAYLFLENLVWGDKPACPHCGSVAKHYFLNAQGEGRKTRTGAVSERRVWKCADKDCRRQFSVLTGTVMHGSKIPVRTWLFVILEICASKNGVSAREIQRKYELTPKTAWFMLHRLREAMKSDGLVKRFAHTTVIADEAWIGGKPRLRYGNIRDDRNPERIVPEKAVVFTLINQATGEARSRVIPDVTAKTLDAAITAQVVTENSRLMTDDWSGYNAVGRKFGRHDTVTHSLGEYVRGDVTTNAVENFFGQLKRSIDGTFHHVSHEHLHRYLAEFDYRYSTRKLTDTDRVHRLMGQARGRRLAYRPLTDGA